MQKIVLTIAAEVMNALAGVTGGHLLAALILLALLVELALLYPSVRLQLKQKKIHLFHKKLVDRFHVGELSYSQTESELGRLYAVNEKMHSRGAVLVVLQALLFLAVLWGLHLLTQSPILLRVSWNVLNFNLLQSPTGSLLPILVSLLYFLHALTKIYCKEKSDYISPTQTFLALVFAVLGSTVLYFFAGTFAAALSVYTAALLAFSTVRYLIVEGHAQTWGELAQHELIEMLRHAEPAHDRFETFSQAWNHLPVVRYINFHLLEEALSISLGLMLALNFFGVFSNSDQDLSARWLPSSTAYAVDIIPVFDIDDITIDDITIVASCSSGCNVSESDANQCFCSRTLGDDSPCASGCTGPALDFTDGYGCFCPALSSGSSGEDEEDPVPPVELTGCPAALTPGQSDTSFDVEGGSGDYDYSATVGTFNGSSYTAPSASVGASGQNVTLTATDEDDSSNDDSCTFKIYNPVTISNCTQAQTVNGLGYTAEQGGATTFQLNPTSCSASICQWSVTSGRGSINSSGLYTAAFGALADPVTVRLRRSDATTILTTCTFTYGLLPLTLDVDQPLIQVQGEPVQFNYEGGPSMRDSVTWELLGDSPAGSLDAETGIYTPSEEVADVAATITLKATDEAFPANTDEKTLTYVAPSCNPDFGFYDLNVHPVALVGQSPTRNVYSGGTYRFYIRNAFEPNAFETEEVDDPDGIIASQTSGVSDDDVPYFDFDFNNIFDSASDNATIAVYDSTVSDDPDACKATLHFNHAGPAIQLRSPQRVHVGL